MSEVADEEWAEAYRRGWRGPWRTKDDVGSPPLSEAFMAHLAYLDGLRADIRELDTARANDRARRAHIVKVPRKWERTP